jgi:tetratricopeptide (TPR) repeat protein
LIGLALALISGPAWAQTPQQRDWCFSPTATDDQTIDGCTALVQTGRATNQAAALDNRAYAYTNKGLYDQAIADYTRSIALKPDDAGAYGNRGAAYYFKGGNDRDEKGLYDQAIADYTQAIADETRAIALKPNALDGEIVPFAYHNRGVSYRHKGLYDQAIADFTRAIALKPNYLLAYQNRGFTYEKNGFRDQAVADYRAALKINPDWAMARDALTRLGATP